MPRSSATPRWPRPRAASRRVDEALDLSRRALRLLPVRAVAGACVRLETRPRDRLEQRLLVARGTELVLIAPQDQRARVDGAVLSGHLGVEEAVEVLPPDAGGDLQAAVDDPVD